MNYPQRRGITSGAKYHRGIDRAVGTRESEDRLFTLHEISAEMGISYERVRQLETEALRKLRWPPGKLREGRAYRDQDTSRKKTVASQRDNMA